jgi:hypothetical protein
MRTRIAATLLAAALTGCASLNNIDSEVSSYSRWPSGRAPATYSFERLPSQQDRPQQSQILEDAARRAIEGAGFVPAPEGAEPDVTVQLGARISETDPWPFYDPFWYRGYAPWHRPYRYSGYYGRSYWGPGWRGGYWGPGGDFPYYQREVAILIRDKRTGEPLYEGRAENAGPTTGIGSILPAMFIAAMKDFPTGSTTNPHRVTVEAQR